MAPAKKHDMAPSIQVGPGRLSFPFVFEMKENDDGNARYECTLLMPPGFDTKPLLDALEKVAVDEFGPRKEWPEKLRKPEDVIRTLTKQAKTMAGRDMDGYLPGWTPVSAAHSKKQPEVYDRDDKLITDDKEVYGGRWGRLVVRPYAYRNKTQGVTLGLHGIRILKHDTKFGGGVDVLAAFAGIDDSGDDEYSEAI